MSDMHLVEMNKQAREIVERATVHLTGKSGLGVLVNSGLILTAAHCIEHYGSGGMAMGDYCLEKFRSNAGQDLTAQVLTVDPVSDIAVLCAPDDQALPDKWDAFEEFQECTTPVPIDVSEPGLFEEFRIHIRTHHGTWTEATAQLCNEGGSRLALEAPIEGGTSGGPIVNNLGELVAIVSWSSEPLLTGMGPRPHRALPVWVWDQIHRG